MKDTVTKLLARARKAHARKRRTAALLLSLSLVVAVGVTWSLRTTGESLTDGAFCGLTEHTHTEECEQQTLTCGLEETDGHTHTDACYTEQQTLTCGQEEDLGHTHTDACYAEQSTLVCGLEEDPGHTHTDECSTTTSTLTCGTEEHLHSDACYTTQTTLVCGLEESEDHTHTDACYETSVTLTCGLAEHTHFNACYTSETTLTCGQEEYEGHTHTDDCYITETVLTCGEEERDPGHVHTDACYTLESALTCGLEECEAHTHTDDCYTIEYICGLDEHTHTLSCYSDPSADLESADTWTAAFSGLELSGDFGADVVAIAETQLGYTESAANYEVVNGTAKGYTRYGAWYGIPYGDWCAMFASFCIHYAGVTLDDGSDYPTAAGCNTWVRELSALGLYAAAGDVTPSVGDLVFFDWTGDGSADHVGIVSGLTSDGKLVVDTAATEDTTEVGTATATDAEVGDDTAAAAEDTTEVEDATPTDAEDTTEVEDAAATATPVPDEEAEEESAADGIWVIEGNYSNAVKENSYSLSYSAILGYGLMPSQEEEEEEDTTDPAARVEELLAASDEDFVTLWTAYYLEASDEDAAALEEYIESLADTDPDTYDALVTRVDTLINGAVEEAAAAAQEADGTFTATTATVNYYVCIDGNWTKLGNVDAQTTVYSYTGTSYYYITGDTLEEIYKAYGFTADMLATARYFPFTTGTGTSLTGGFLQVYSVTDAASGTKTYYSPISKANTVNVYYLPTHSFAQNTTPDSYTTSDTFYSVTVTDPGSKVYTTDKLPDTKYILTGSDGTVTVKTAEGVTWRCLDSSGQEATGGYTRTDNGDGTAVFAFASVSQAYTLTTQAADEYTVTYNLNLPSGYDPIDETYGTPQIGGSATTYVDVAAADEAYTVMTPSPDSYFYGIANGETADYYYGTVEFQGWAASDDTTTVQYKAGAEIDAVSGNLALYAVWSEVASNTTGDTMINFYIEVNAVAEDQKTKWTSNEWTTSVYAYDCGVAGSAAVNSGYTSGTTSLWTDADGNTLTGGYSGDSNYYEVTLFGGSSGTGQVLSENHTKITDQLSRGISYNGTTCKVVFPDDEEMLRTVRSKVKSGTTISFPTYDENGSATTMTVLVDQLTADNFTVKWNVFKYSSNDGWHIDGVLVAKKGTLTVTKTFAGDTSVIDDDFKSGYSIAVYGGADSAVYGGADSTTTTLTLNSKADQETLNETNSTGYTGYTSYDQDTNTYTWTVSVDQYYLYQVTETGYVTTATDSEGYTYTTTAQYRVKNDLISEENNASRNVKNWTAYDSGTGVYVTGNATSAGTTVSFLNTYTAPGTLVIQKADYETGDLMPNISFDIDKTVYQNGTTSYYSYLQDTTYTGETTTVTTDYSGQAYILLNAGTYTFTEHDLEGYDNPGEIIVTLSKEGSGDGGAHVGIEAITYTDSSGTRVYASQNTDIASKLVMTVNNYTSEYIDLTVTKVWSDDEDKSVAMQLYRNGTSMGKSYKVTLDGTTDETETTAWTYTWSGLPLYVNGKLADYTIEETSIGDFYYYDSSTDADGYKYYDVTKSKPVYTTADGDECLQADADLATITVTNKRTTTDVNFTKTDENGNPLAGAYFKLYYIENTSEATDINDATVSKDPAFNDTNTGLEASTLYTLTATKSSDADGTVSFGYKLSNGYYYLVESQAPDGYVLSGKLYLLKVAGSDVTLYQRTTNAETGGYEWTELTGNKLANTPRTYAATLTVTKVEAGTSGAALPGASFTLQNKTTGAYYTGEDTDNDSVLDWSADAVTFTTGAAGTLTFTLPEGKYTLTETAAPTGYYILNSTYTITVNAKGKIISFLKSDGSALNTTSGTLAWDDEKGYTTPQAYDIENYSGYKLPSTGGAGTTWYTLGGLAVMAGAAMVGYGLRRRRGRRAD